MPDYLSYAVPPSGPLADIILDDHVQSPRIDDFLLAPPSPSSRPSTAWSEAQNPPVGDIIHSRFIAPAADPHTPRFRSPSDPTVVQPAIRKSTAWVPPEPRIPSGGYEDELPPPTEDEPVTRFRAPSAHQGKATLVPCHTHSPQTRQRAVASL